MRDETCKVQLETAEPFFMHYADPIALLSFSSIKLSS